MLENTMKEKEIIALFMLPPYLKYKLLNIICIGYHIGRELDLKVNGLLFCGVLLMLSRTIQFENTFVSL
jgi:hypothetical protein